MIRKYAFSGADVREDIERRYTYSGDFLDIYAQHSGAIMHKWHHYLPLYDRYFGPWRRRAPRFLEIGVSKGGSLEMWRKFFGSEATIFGIDIDPQCAQYDGQAAQVRIGSQDDPNFLKQVVEEMGGVDRILDDGSHHMDHIPASLNVLFPRLEMGGVYMIEDLHTAYWKQFGGGLDAPGNFFSRLRGMADDMHRWYHRGPLANPQFQGQIGGIHVHDSILVLDKQLAEPPTHSHVGR